MNECVIIDNYVKPYSKPFHHYVEILKAICQSKEIGGKSVIKILWFMVGWKDRWEGQTVLYILLAFKSNSYFYAVDVSDFFLYRTLYFYLYYYKLL